MKPLNSCANLTIEVTYTIQAMKLLKAALLVDKVPLAIFIPSTNMASIDEAQT